MSETKPLAPEAEATGTGKLKQAGNFPLRRQCVYIIVVPLDHERGPCEYEFVAYRFLYLNRHTSRGLVSCITNADVL